jgi:hypothetical protein
VLKYLFLLIKFISSLTKMGCFWECNFPSAHQNKVG